MAKNIGLHKSSTWLHNRFVIKKYTLSQMAKEAGVSIEMINQSLKKEGLK